MIMPCLDPKAGEWLDCSRLMNVTVDSFFLVKETCSQSSCFATCRFAVPHLLRNMRILAKEVVANVLRQH